MFLSGSDVAACMQEIQNLEQKVREADASVDARVDAREFEREDLCSRLHAAIKDKEQVAERLEELSKQLPSLRACAAELDKSMGAGTR